MDNQILDETLATTYSLLIADGLEEAANLLRRHPATAQQTGYDNWNGGTETWDIKLSIPAAEYSRLKQNREQLEEQINSHLRYVVESQTQDWYSVKIVPALESSKNWRTGAAQLTRQIRQNIFDGFRLQDFAWHGRLDCVEFLNRIYDLQNLPSTDSRFKDAAGDIWQHCVNNEDWDRDWVFSDSRFNLVDGPQEKFLRFLCEVVHPLVRQDREEAVYIAKNINEQLRLAGWELYEEELIVGRPRFSY